MSEKRKPCLPPGRVRVLVSFPQYELWPIGRRIKTDFDPLNDGVLICGIYSFSEGVSDDELDDMSDDVGLYLDSAKEALRWIREHGGEEISL